jgi:hypothetical protein
MFFNLSFLINSPGCVSAGHPSEQGASWQRRQRSASTIAWANPNPLRISLNLSAALTGSLLDINLNVVKLLQINGDTTHFLISEFGFNQGPGEIEQCFTGQKLWNGGMALIYRACASCAD